MTYSELLLLTLNETTLFFHNRRFDTPDTKKHVRNFVKEWSQSIDIPTPPQARKKTTSSIVSSTLVPSTVDPKSRARATVLENSDDPLKPKKKGQHRGKDAHPTNPVIPQEPGVSSSVYGGLEEEDDTLEYQAMVKSSVAEVRFGASVRTENRELNLAVPVQFSVQFNVGALSSVHGSRKEESTVRRFEPN